MGQPQLYVIAGPNGAGKTTFAREFLLQYARCRHFINADLIAGGLSPFSPEQAALRAGRLVLERIGALAKEQADFGFETTLSGVTYLSWFRRLRAQGYTIHLFFLWIPSVEIALARIADRVRRGGHDIPEHVVRRRFHKGLRHLLRRYRPLLDTWNLFDNSGRTPQVIVREEASVLQVLDQTLYADVMRAAER